jgi:hypothetical protein
MMLTKVTGQIGRPHHHFIFLLLERIRRALSLNSVAIILKSRPELCWEDLFLWHCPEGLCECGHLCAQRCCHQQGQCHPGLKRLFMLSATPRSQKGVSWMNIGRVGVQNTRLYIMSAPKDKATTPGMRLHSSPCAARTKCHTLGT